MTLRLADLYFDSAVEINKTQQIDEKAIEKYQAKAVTLYEKALSGFDGEISRPARAKQRQIKFQLSRLYSDQGKRQEAEKIWNELVLQSDDKDLQRESALRLAEVLELSAQPIVLIRAGELYDIALGSVKTQSLLSYAQYRRGWIYYRLGNSAEGARSLLSSLATTDKSSIDNLLKDLILFLSHSENPTNENIELLEKLGRQYSKVDLIDQLSSGYFLADHGQAYYETLSYLINKKPVLERFLSRLEFEYSHKTPSDVLKTLALAKEAQQKAIQFSTSEKALDGEKLLYRLIVQWDGERKVRKEVYTEIFDSAVMLYTSLFPKGEQFDKVISGWLALDYEKSKKLETLRGWRLQQMQLNSRSKEVQISIYEMTLAKENKDWPLVINRADFLIQNVGNSSQKRTYLYQKARAEYEEKAEDLGLSIFVDLASPSMTAPDEIAVFSQNLALDILGEKKQYSQMQIQAEKWLQSPIYQERAERSEAFKKELTNIKGISERALFAEASARPDKASLKIFKDFCLSGKYQPQACENARVLAVQLRDEQTLLEVLAKSAKRDDLLPELEFAGRFKDAAALREHELGQSKDYFADYIKVALLYELDGQFQERDRVLNRLVQKISLAKASLSKQQENLLFLTLNDAGLMSPALLNLSWSRERKLRLASELESQGRGSAETKKLLVSSCKELGEAWYRFQLQKLKTINQSQEKLSIVGRQSKSHFERRVKALEDLSHEANCLLASSREDIRLAVTKGIARSYDQFANQIEEVPLPKDLDEETKVAVIAQVKTMAQPFRERAQDWSKQADLMVNTLGPEKMKNLDSRYLALTWSFDYEPAASAESIAPKSLKVDWQDLLASLQNDPFEHQNEQKLKDHFEKLGQARLALYFQGRLSDERKTQ